MQHPHSTPTATSSTRPDSGRGDAFVMPGGDDARAISLEAMRNLRSPLAALRVLLEGQAGSGEAGKMFRDRALEEIERAEAAAGDLIAWTMPRSLRRTHATLGEMVQCLRESLGPADRRRTHFVAENEDTSIECDARLLVTNFARSLRHAYRDAGAQPLEIMVHAHASEGLATFSFIYTGEESCDEKHGAQGPSLADALLAMNVDRVNGRLNIHEAEGHRCAVVTLPTTKEEVPS